MNNHTAVVRTETFTTIYFYDSREENINLQKTVHDLPTSKIEPVTKILTEQTSANLENLEKQKRNKHG